MSDDDILVVFRRWESDTDYGGVDDIRDRARDQDHDVDELEHAPPRGSVTDYSDARWGDVDDDE